MLRVFPCFVLVLVLVGPGARGQDRVVNPHEAPAPDPALLEHPPTGPALPVLEPRAARRGPVVLTRQDVAWAFLRLESAFAGSRPTGEALSLANGAADSAAVAFFRGDKVLAARALDIGTRRLRGLSGNPAAQAASQLKVRVSPAVWTYYRPPAPSVLIDSVSAWKPEEGVVVDWPSLSVLIEGRRADHAPPEAPASSVLLKIPAPDGEGNVSAQLDLSGFYKELRPGRYDVSITGEGGFSWAVGRWYVVTAPRDEVRRLNLELVEQLRPEGEEMRAAVATLRARVNLLRDSPTEESSSGMLTDQAGLETEVLLEYSAIMQGRNPYHRRTGTYYRVFTSQRIDLPVWVHAPASASGDAPMPLVIALHGAGADEGMFMHGHGDGALRRLADERGFIAASPLSYVMTTNTGALDDLIESLKRDYAVDGSRVYLIGHSMGAIAASSLAQARSGKLAGVVAVAGLRALDAGTACAPILAYAADQDQIIPAERVVRAAETARTAGLDVELRELKGYGHALAVDGALEEGIDWLLGKRLRGATP